MVMKNKEYLFQTLVQYEVDLRVVETEKKKKTWFVSVTQDFSYTHQFQWERFKKRERKPCFSGVIREEAPFCRHCFVSLSNPWRIIKGLTDITAFAASSHLAEWLRNNTQMKWQAIKSKYRSCKEKQNSRWGQGYFIVFSVLNLSL